MKTKKEREAAFRADLTELLTRHKAELRITDDEKPYGLHQGVAEITMSSEYDADGYQTAEFTDFRI